MNHYHIFENRAWFLRASPERCRHHALSNCRREAPNPPSDCFFGVCRRSAARAAAEGCRSGCGGEGLFRGKETDFSRFDLDLQGQDTFFEKVYQAARKIPWGTARRPTARLQRSSEQVRSGPGCRPAMAKNPVALIIPCHRVLAAGGKIGGFSAPGVHPRSSMLEMEGVKVAPPEPAQQSLGF